MENVMKTQSNKLFRIIAGNIHCRRVDKGGYPLFVYTADPLCHRIQDKFVLPLELSQFGGPFSYDNLQFIFRLLKRLFGTLSFNYSGQGVGNGVNKVLFVLVSFMAFGNIQIDYPKQLLSKYNRGAIMSMLMNTLITSFVPLVQMVGKYDLPIGRRTAAEAFAKLHPCAISQQRFGKSLLSGHFQGLSVIPDQKDAPLGFQ